MPKPETVSSAKPETVSSAPSGSRRKGQTEPESRFFRGAKASDVGYGDRGSRA